MFPVYSFISRTANVFTRSFVLYMYKNGLYAQELIN